jgi:hypothetical protein
MELSAESKPTVYQEENNVVREWSQYRFFGDPWCGIVPLRDKFKELFEICMG